MSSILYLVDKQTGSCLTCLSDDTQAIKSIIRKSSNISNIECHHKKVDFNNLKLTGRYTVLVVSRANERVAYTDLSLNQVIELYKYLSEKSEEIIIFDDAYRLNGKNILEIIEHPNF